MSEWFVDANTTVIFRSGQVRSDVGGRVGVWMCMFQFNEEYRKSGRFSVKKGRGGEGGGNS